MRGARLLKTAPLVAGFLKVSCVAGGQVSLDMVTWPIRCKQIPFESSSSTKIASGAGRLRVEEQDPPNITWHMG